MQFTIFKGINKRLTVYEIALTGIILGIALAAKYFDNFIPHVHPIAVTIILIGIATMRITPSIILLTTFIGMNYLLFGFSEVSPMMAIFHIIHWLVLLVFAAGKIFKVESKIKRLVIDIVFITLSLLLYLTFMIIADSEYSAGQGIPFGERVRLALIWPGDWLNVTITLGVSVSIVPLFHLIYTTHIGPKLNKNLW